MTPKRTLSKFILLISASFAVLSFCNQAATAPDADAFPYQLSNARVVELPESLAEISGVIYNPKVGSLQAIQDETGELYTITLANKASVTAANFGGRGDYEDLALINNQVFVLESNGNVTSFSADKPGTVQSYAFPQKGKNDFETLLYQSSTGKLLLLCKACKGGKKNSVAAWEFDPKTGNYSASAFSFDLKNAKGISGSKGVQPSAAATHPKTGEVYFLSSANSLLFVADASGVVKGTYQLDKKLYPQPEGICFLPNGDLVISNEKGTSSTATLIIASPVK